MILASSALLHLHLVTAALPLRLLTLDEAVATARARQPALRVARATTEAAHARAVGARAALLPQVSAVLGYQRATANFAPRPGSLPHGFTLPNDSTSFDSFNYFSGGVTLNQWLFDFGQTIGAYRAARAAAEASRVGERVSVAGVVLRVRLAFLQARAQKALLAVADEALAAQTRHLEQIDGFVQVGTRPSIDLVQARADLARAKLQRINAENGYATARAQLAQAMGLAALADFEVADETLPPVPGEDQPVAALAANALRERPEFAELDAQRRAEELSLRAKRGAYWPSLGLALSFNEAGAALDDLAWNFGFSVSLVWPLLQGGQTWAQARAARANLAVLQAQVEGRRQQVQLEVVEARLGVRAAKEAVSAATQAQDSARERLRLAEGRYETGVGNGIELADAQSQHDSAAAQRVAAEFNLAAARAQLLFALGQAPAR
jgi:outer membrane protein